MSIRILDLVVQLGAQRLELTAHCTQPITGVFGPSGAGKTALLEAIAGVRRPLGGRIELDGVAVFDREQGIDLPSRVRRVGYVPQDHALFPHLSVQDNLEFGASEAGDAGAMSLSHVVDVLEIGPLLDRHPSRLSGGERQRVALGRALRAAPRILLLDEPLASLDAALRDRALALLRRVQTEFAIPMLYVTHAPDEVMALCDDVLLLIAGRGVAQAAPSALFEVAPAPQWQVRPEYDARSPR